jgi:hypothetical protein
MTVETVENYLSFFKSVIGGSNNKNCPNHVYYAKPNYCAKNIKWKGPGGGPNTFYTTWSFFLNFVILGLAIIVFIFHLIAPHNNIKNTLVNIITPSIIGIIGNIIGVFLVAQILIAYEWSIKDTTPNTRSDDGLAVSNSFIITVNKINFIYHQLPVLFIIPLIFILYAIKSKITTKTIIYALIFMCAFFIIWDIIPVDKTSDGSIPGKTNPLNKPKYVYNYPPFWLMLLLPVSWVVVCFLFYFVAVRNSHYASLG